MRKNKGNKRILKVQPKEVMVNGHSSQWLQKNFDWVYAKEIIAKGNTVSHGSTVQIIDSEKKYLGTGIFSDGEIAVRRFSKETVAIDEKLFAEIAEKCLFRRRIPAQTTAWRLIHAENDDAPGIRVDVWNDELSIILSCTSLEPYLESLLNGLRKVRPFHRAWGHIRKENGKQQSLGLLWGSHPRKGYCVKELGLEYWVTPQHSRDAGLFCDMRDLRHWLAPHWEERRFLNLFCYTGAFSVSAAAHGASEVHSVDLSYSYLQTAKLNFENNNLSPENHKFVEGDAFQVLDRYRRKNEGFDVVLADPPSFSHSSNGVWSVQKDLRRLVIACLRVLAPGGWLIISTNHGKMSPREFSKAIMDAASKEKRRLRLLHNYSTPTDFPAAIHFPEGRYLKCWVIQA
jgi:23S rRNA (cytosine1962-C5)-methyltransferase